MKYLFPAAVFGCLSQAFAATFCWFFMVLLYDAFRDLWYRAFSLLIITWPLWSLVFWKLAKNGRGKASAATVAVGLVIFFPVIIMVLDFYLGYEIPCPE